MTSASDTVLTLDNTFLSRPTFLIGTKLAALSAINCTHAVDGTVASLLRDSLAENTRRAYFSDLHQFEAWGGRIPASPETVAAYLAANAGTLSVATLVRRLASLSRAHGVGGYPNPVRSPLVRATLRGIKRRHGSAQRQAKPLLKEDLVSAFDAMGNSLRDIRDRAVLLIGFAGAFRRSELVALDRNDIDRVRQGIVVRIRRSKTDQVGAGRTIGIPLGRARWCPVAALDLWFELSGMTDGAVFRPVDRRGHVGRSRLSGEAVALIVKERVAAAGFNPDTYSGHSLRAGFVTSAAQAGVPSWRIRAQTGHASDAMLSRYIRVGELFTDTAGALL